MARLTNFHRQQRWEHEGWWREVASRRAAGGGGDRTGGVVGVGVGGTRDDGGVGEGDAAATGN
jgi:hypothetical protein